MSREKFMGAESPMPSPDRRNVLRSPEATQETVRTERVFSTLLLLMVIVILLSPNFGPAWVARS